jgi:RNA polymerase sigma factor for flagellar operon FliA
LSERAGDIIEPIDELWQRFTQHHHQQDREMLILHYLYLASYVVRRMTFKLPPSLTREDLVSFGVIGLLEAVDRFDPTQGVPFSHYAVPRIRGQIIDSLRSLDMVPRTVYQHTKALAQATARLNQTLGRSPTDQEVADQLGISLKHYRRWLADANLTIVSFEQTTMAGDGDPLPLWTTLEDRQTPTPPQVADKLTVRSELRSLIRDLPERDQQLLFLYYHKHLTMKEVAKILGVTESRISQIHATVVRTLRDQLHRRLEPKPVSVEHREIRQPARLSIAELRRQAWSYA